MISPKMESSDEYDSDEASSTSASLLETAIGKNGTRWTLVISNIPGRLSAQNVFSGRSEMSYCRNIERTADAWRLLIDEGCIRHIMS